MLKFDVIQNFKPMKKILLILSALFLLSGSVSVMAQKNNNLTSREQRKQKKQKKMEAQLVAAIAELKKVNKLVEDTNFVFVVTSLYGTRGSLYNVDPSINFLGVNKGQAVYQFAFTGLVGWNGLGGATFEGDITNYDFKPSENIKKASVLSMRFKRRGVAGSPYISMSFFGQKATVDITFGTGEHIRLDGMIKSIKDAGVYKGQSIF